MMKSREFQQKLDVMKQQISLSFLLYLFLCVGRIRGSDLKKNTFYRISMESNNTGDDCINGADKKATGSLIFEEDNKLNVHAYRLPANCKGTLFKRSAIICPNPVARTLHVETIGTGTIQPDLKTEVNSFKGGKVMEATVTRQPFLDDVDNTNFKNLNLAPDAIFEVDLTDWLTDAELQYMQVEFVVEDRDFKGHFDEKSVKKMAHGKFQVGTECPGIDHEFRSSTQNRNVLTFRSQGRHALSFITRPKLARAKWYLSIWLFQTDDLDKANAAKMDATTKNIRLYVEKRDVSVGKQLMPMLVLVAISIIGGILVLLYFHFLLQERFPLKPFHWTLWFQLMFIYFLRGRKPYAQMTVFFSICFGVGIIQAAIHVYLDSLHRGDRDICQYNERCHSAFFHRHDVSWNSLWSNIIYIIHGLFIILSFSLKEAYCYSRKHYFYYDYCVCYALGWSLCFVGLFSGFYHICPGRVTFQMDTTFMFTMSILIMVGVIHGKSTRSEDILLASHSIKLEPRMRESIHAGEVFLFFLAPLVFFNFLGALKDQKPPRQGDYVDASIYKGYGLSFSWTICYAIAVFIWLIGVLVAGAFKMGLWNNPALAKGESGDDANKNEIAEEGNEAESVTPNNGIADKSMSDQGRVHTRPNIFDDIQRQ